MNEQPLIPEGLYYHRDIIQDIFWDTYQSRQRLHSLRTALLICATRLECIIHNLDILEGKRSGILHWVAGPDGRETS